MCLNRACACVTVEGLVKHTAGVVCTRKNTYWIPCLIYFQASVMSLYSRLCKMKQTRKYSDFISESAAAGVNVKQMGFSTLIILTS